MLQRVKQLFLSLFEPYLQSLVDVLSNRGGVVDQSRSALRTLGEKIVEDRWDKIFDRCLKNFEGSGGRSRSLPQRQIHLAAGPTDSSELLGPLLPADVRPRCLGRQQGGSLC